MLKKRRFASFVIAAYFIASAGAAGAAADGDFSLAADYWRPEVMGGKIRATGGDVKLEDDLGLGAKGASGVTLSYKANDGQIIFVRGEGAIIKETKSLTRSFGFAGADYIAGDSVKTRLQVNNLQIGIRKEKMTSHGKISTIYSYNHGLVRTELRDITRNFSREKETSFDSFGLGCGWESMHAGSVNYFVEATPLLLGIRGGGYGDFNTGLKAKLGNKSELTLGYRVEAIAAIEDKHRDFAKPILAGPYFCLNTKF